MTPRDDTEPRGDLADQATDAIFAAEQAAIRAALARKHDRDDETEFVERSDG
ncbi:MAG TPA: hypothetical protein VFL59_05185 [Candidatus Nanopelagicales bacterium]|nr:hypothetical protein [Candidatus Nanopelagicales bacterium]